MKTLSNKTRTSKGFTLIEALIVVIIVGLLASVGVIKLASAKTDTQAGLARSAAAEINKGLQRAVVANDGAGYATAITVAASPDALNSTFATNVITQLVAAGHFTNASGTAMSTLLAQAPTSIYVKCVSASAPAAGATTLKALGDAGVEFVAVTP